MSVPYSALITADDLAAEAQSAYSFDLTDANTLTTAEAIIQEVTAEIEGAAGLNRNLIVRQYTHYFTYKEWDYDQASDVYFVQAPQWPIVEIDTSGFSSATSKHAWQNEANLITYTSRYSGSVNYYAGYKRSEQSLSDLQTPLPNLGTAAGDLPYDIRNVAINGTLMLLAERRQGPGQRTKVMNPAVQTTTVQEPIIDYVRRLIKTRLYHHRRL